MDDKPRWDRPPFLAAGDDAELSADAQRFVSRDKEIEELKKLLKNNNFNFKN